MSYHALALLNINLVANDDLLRVSMQLRLPARRTSYKWETLGVHGAGLDEELVAPAVQRVEALCVVHVVHQHAAIGTTVEGHAERLEALLTRCVP